ncbi:phage tail spike protein [Jeotgalibaca porci]|uniref:phage tail spike protein n=1 Tax=Jeotgalibaca porci TaxID=1868793 RepID=UPI00359F2D3C
MLTIYNLNREPTAILENAYGVGYSKEDNVLTTGQFSLPANDEKKVHIKPLYYAEIVDGTDEQIGLFRVLPKKHEFSANQNELTYELEHVLGTLMGKALFKYHQFTNYVTREVIERLLNMQTVKNWVLGDCEFTRYFHYSFENENLLSAIFSVPKTFDEPYVWETDTTVYPWVLHLRKPQTEIASRAIQGYNLQDFKIEENPNSLWNRIYPLGAGEGVNQLDIKKVNNGESYVENASSIARYGLYETVWVDKRFIDSASLKSSALKLLEKWSEPIITWQGNVLDLSSITGIKADKIRQGKLCRVRLDDYGDIDMRVISESNDDVFENDGQLNVVLGNALQDLGTTQADLDRRQQVNELYSQGATNILNFGYQDNCDNTTPAVIPFYIDDDVVNVNTIELTYRTKKFRAYSGVTKGGGSLVKSTSSGGATVKSTSSGGGSTATSSSGGGVVKTTASGGGTTQTSTVNGQSTQTSSAGGDHHHKMFQTTGNGGGEGLPVNATAGGGIVIQLGPNTPKMTDIYTNESSGNHSHSVTTPAHAHDVNIPAHAHEFSTPNHEHNVNIPNHTHQIDIPNHTHEIDIPDHTHEILHKIVEAPNSPTNVVVKVDGNTVPQTALQGDRINLVNYINKGSDGNVTRGRHEITITPNTIARIEADVILRVFIRSQLGGQL